MEDEKSELKNEFANLHHRNTELLRSYCDLMERVKILIGNEELINSNFGSYSSLENKGLAKLKRTNAELIENFEKNTNLKEFKNEIENAARDDDRLKENMSHYVKSGNRSDYTNLNELMSMEDNQSMLEMPMDEPAKENPSLSGLFFSF